MTLLASMTTECMGPCVAVVGATTRVVFENYGERHLAPVLSPGQVIMMDDLGAHKGERVRELIVVPPRPCTGLRCSARTPALMLSP
jgi:hypothetical protein